MFPVDIVLLGLALAIDAAVVTFTVGLLHLELRRTHRVQRGLIISLAFGVFQGVMLWLGSYAGYLFTFSNFGYYSQLAIAVIFFGLAFKCFQESFNMEQKHIEWGIIPVGILAFATSIDALASGVSLATVPRAYFASIEVGIITTSVCASFYFISQFFKEIPDRWLLRIAGLIFIFLGGEVLWSIRQLFLRG